MAIGCQDEVCCEAVCTLGKQGGSNTALSPTQHQPSTVLCIMLLFAKCSRPVLACFSHYPLLETLSVMCRLKSYG